MLLDLNGNKKDDSQETRSDKKISKDEFIRRFQNLMDNFSEHYCLFYCKNGVMYRISNASETQIHDFITYNKQIELENIIYQCIDNYFYCEDCEDELELLDKIFEDIKEEDFDDPEE